MNNNDGFKNFSKQFADLITNVDQETKNEILGRNFTYFQKLTVIKEMTDCPVVINRCNDLIDDLYRQSKASGEYY